MSPRCPNRVVTPRQCRGLKAYRSPHGLPLVSLPPLHFGWSSRAALPGMAEKTLYASSLLRPHHPLHLESLV